MKKRKIVLKIASLLIAYAIIVPSNGSHWVLGEPLLPKKLSK